MATTDWNHLHEGQFKAEIVGSEAWGIVARDESLISAAIRAFSLAFHRNRKLTVEEKFALMDVLEIAEYSTQLNVLRIRVKPNC